MDFLYCQNTHTTSNLLHFLTVLTRSSSFDVAADWRQLWRRPAFSLTAALCLQMTLILQSTHVGRNIFKTTFENYLNISLSSLVNHIVASHNDWKMKLQINADTETHCNFDDIDSVWCLNFNIVDCWLVQTLELSFSQFHINNFHSIFQSLTPLWEGKCQGRN